MRKIRSFLRSRTPVLLALLVLVGGLAIGFHWYHDLPTAWHIFRVPSLSPDFADTRTVTHHIDCLLKGRDPYVDGSCSPWHLPYNYPPIWLELWHLGVNSSTTNLMGGLLAAMFFTASLSLFRARNWVTGTAVFLALLSWPVLFALERGNTDLAIFSILTLGGLWIGCSRERFIATKQTLLIVVLTVLKIYPVVAVAGMVRNRKAIWKAFIAGTLALAALLITAGSRLPLIWHNTPQGGYRSFGSVPLYMRIAECFGRVGVNHHYRVLFAISFAAIGVTVGLVARRVIAKLLPSLDLNSARGFIAAGGLAIYVSVFLVGSSFDYRLIFLLCPLMYFIEELNERITIRSCVAVAILLLFLWCSRIDVFIGKLLLDAGIFVCSCAWLTDTLRRALEPRSESPTTEDSHLVSMVGR